MSYYNEGNFNFPNSTYEIDEFKQNYFANSNENNSDCLCPCHYENRIVEQNVNLNSNNSTCISGEDGFKNQNNFIYEMQELRERNKKLNDDLINLSNVKNSADAYIKELEKENFRLNQLAKDDKQRENDILKNDINRYRDMLDEALFLCGKVGDVSGINVKNDLDYYVNNKNDYDKMITSLIDWTDRLKGNNTSTNIFKGKYNEYDSGIYSNTNDTKQQPQMKAFNSSGNFNRVNDDVYKINDGMMYGTNNSQKGFNYINDVNNRMNKGNEEISMRTTKFDMINNKINNIKQTSNPNTYNSNVQQLSENKGQIKQYGNNSMNNQVMMNKPLSNYDQLQQQNQMKAKAPVISNNSQDIKPVTSNNNPMIKRPSDIIQPNSNQQPLSNVNIQNQNKQYQYNPISKQVQMNKNQPLQEKKQVNKSFDVNSKQPKQFNSNDVHYLSYYPNNNNNDEDAFIAHSKDKPKQSHLSKSATNPNTQIQQSLSKKPNDITTQSDHYSRINNKINNINNRIETYKEKHHIYRNVNPKSSAPSKQSQSHSQVKTIHKPRVKPAFDATTKKENYQSNNTNDYEFQGPCFACEVGCNVSNTGYSPMTFSPYNPGYRRRSVTPLKIHSRSSSSQKRV